MNLRKLFPQTARRTTARLPKLALLTLLAGAATLPLTTKAALISAVTVGPATAPYTYYLTVEFANSNYYDFTLRSTAATLTGDTFINTVASYPAANMTVDQQFFNGLGYYVNGITVGSDSNSGYNSTTNQFWAYWNGTATTPVQWTSPQNFGESGRTLTPGQADGWVYSTGDNPPQATSFPVPEPGTFLLTLLPLAGWLVFRRVRQEGGLPPV